MDATWDNPGDNRVVGLSGGELDPLSPLTRMPAQTRALYDTVKGVYGEVMGACDVDRTGWTVGVASAKADRWYATVVPTGTNAFVVVYTHGGYGSEHIESELQRCVPYASIGFDEALEIVIKPLKEKYHGQ